MSPENKSRPGIAVPIASALSESGMAHRLATTGIEDVLNYTGAKEQTAHPQFADFGLQIRDLILDVISGEKKKRRAAERVLIAKATSGNLNDLLDVANAAITIWIAVRKPEAVGLRFERPAIQQARAAKDLRDFISDLFKTLSQESRIHVYNIERTSSREKVASAKALAINLRQAFSKSEIDSFPQSLKDYLGQVYAAPTHIEYQGQKVILSVSPELTQLERQRLTQITQKDPREISRSEFDLVMKASQNFNAHPKQESTSVQARVYDLTQDDDFEKTVQLFAGSLKSNDPAVRNRTTLILNSMTRRATDVLNLKRYSLFQILQRKVLDMIDNPEQVSPDLKSAIEDIIAILDANDILGEFATALASDYDYVSAQLKDENLQTLIVKPNPEILSRFASKETDSQALELLAKTALEIMANQIDKGTFSELFDERRGLGYFMQNLQAQWRQLQTLTRDQIWPSFITRRRAKIWPSERELDILQFTGTHPASVLGFSGIRFYTRGFNPPEVGVEFTFKENPKVLRARLDKDGNLCALPFDLESESPHIHAFLEHIAVTSFEELVTIASKRIKVQRDSKVADSRALRPSSQLPEERQAYAQSLPRRETSYITLTDEYNSQTAISDNVIEDARERERLPCIIPQKVVPLPYAVRYRHLIRQAKLARERGAGENEIKDLEDQAAYNLSLVPNPSPSKVNNLPPQFQLEKVAGGKRIETWRIDHIRPKPKKGEVVDLSKVFERRYRAAPIVLTEHLATWFTQPPAFTGPASA